jgi:hypothetical protein
VAVHYGGQCQRNVRPYGECWAHVVLRVFFLFPFSTENCLWPRIDTPYIYPFSNSNLFNFFDPFRLHTFDLETCTVRIIWLERIMVGGTCHVEHS